MVTKFNFLKCVSTMADECKPVGLEISASSKRGTLRNKRTYSQCDW